MRSASQACEGQTESSDALKGNISPLGRRILSHVPPSSANQALEVRLMNPAGNHWRACVTSLC